MDSYALTAVTCPVRLLTNPRHNEYENFSIPSSGRAWTSVILVGNSDGRRHSSTSFRPPPHASGYFCIHNFFFPDSKVPTSTRIRSQIRFARPHVSGFTLVPRTPLEKIGNRACVVKRAKFASCSALREPDNEVDILKTVFTVKNWAWYCYVTGWKSTRI